MAEWLDYEEAFEGGGSRVAGTVKVLRDVRSDALGNTRDILVYLPPSYPTANRTYPTLYMHDGQNLFDEATSFAGEWRVDEALEALAEEGIEAIVVGVPNTGVGPPPRVQPVPRRAVRRRPRRGLRQVHRRDGQAARRRRLSHDGGARGDGDDRIVDGRA